MLGFGGVANADPDYYNVGALSTLLGEGMSSRLFQQIREKRGLAYSVFSSAQSFSDSGVFSIYLGTGRDDIPKLVPVLRDEIRKVAEAVADDEVKRARAQIKAGILMSLESPGSRCAQNARQIMVYGRPLTTAEVIAKVEAVNAAGITNIAAKVFSSTPTLAALGEAKSLDGLGVLRGLA